MALHTSADYTCKVITIINAHLFMMIKGTIFCFAIMTTNLNAQGLKKDELKDTLIMEIRTYSVKPGKRNDFHNLVVKTLPLLKKYNIEVVRYGSSLHDSTSYVLIRSFKDLEERGKLEDAFYGSDDWKSGSRDPVMALIETYTTSVMPVHKTAVDYLKIKPQ